MPANAIFYQVIDLGSYTNNTWKYKINTTEHDNYTIEYFDIIKY